MFYNMENLINKRNVDKLVFDSKNKKVVSKVEFYSYFGLENLEKLINFLKKSFIFETNTKNFPKIMNPILNMEWKYSLWNGKIINKSETHLKHYYYNEFSRVIIHRKTPYLIRIYRQYKNHINYFKLEITYCKHNKGYNSQFRDIVYKVKWINEIIKKIESFANPISRSEIDDYSWKIQYSEFIKIASSNFDTNKKIELESLLNF